MARNKQQAPASPLDLAEDQSLHGQVEPGHIQISEDVISAIVRKYTLSVPGVVRLGGQGLGGTLASMFGKRPGDRSIVIEVDGMLANITVTIILRFGEHVPTVATNVQSVVRKYVTQMTGQAVGQVNVVVQGLDMDSLDENGGEGGDNRA